MGLNIKNERVHALAREAARVTGKTQTGAIEEALELLLSQAGHDPAQWAVQQRVDVARAIALDYRRDPGDRHREIRSVEDLYDDETGLPQ